MYCDLMEPRSRLFPEFEFCFSGYVRLAWLFMAFERIEGVDTDLHARVLVMNAGGDSVGKIHIPSMVGDVSFSDARLNRLFFCGITLHYSAVYEYKRSLQLAVNKMELIQIFSKR